MIVNFDNSRNYLNHLKYRVFSIAWKIGEFGSIRF